MPELPEVQTVTSALNSTIKNLVVKRIEIKRKNLRFNIPSNMKTVLPGRKVVNIYRRAKYGIINFDNGYSIIFHLGMSGSIVIQNQLDFVLGKHDHIIFEFFDKNKIISCIYRDPRRFGFFLFYKNSSNKFKNYFNKVGQEPLSSKFSIDKFYKLINSKNTSIKSALLDQRVLAGLGNIYVCESLFLSSIRPTRKCKNLSYNETKNLYINIVKVLTKAIDEGGTSLKDHKNISGEIGYFQNFLSVYDKKGKKCANKNCNMLIKKIIQNGRSSFFCQKCQK